MVSRLGGAPEAMEVSEHSVALPWNRVLMATGVVLMGVLGLQLIGLHRRVTTLEVALLMDSTLLLAVERGSPPSDVERDLRALGTNVYRHGKGDAGTFRLECEYVEKGLLLPAPIVVHGSIYYVDHIPTKWDRVMRHRLNTP